MVQNAGLCLVVATTSSVLYQICIEVNAICITLDLLCDLLPTCQQFQRICNSNCMGTRESQLLVTRQSHYLVMYGVAAPVRRVRLAQPSPSTSIMASSSNDPGPKMPPKTADLEETWTFLNIGVDHIMNKYEEGLSFVYYTNLYTTVYNYCTSTKMQNSRADGNRSAFMA